MHDLELASVGYGVFYHVCLLMFFWCIGSQLDCPAALERIKDGRPITIRDDKGNVSKSIAEIVSVK